MPKRFIELTVNLEERYSLGRDEATGDYYLSIPVSNQMIDYEEFYRLSADEYESFAHDASTAAAFADACRKRHRDDRLILQPGSDRGVAI